MASVAAGTVCKVNALGYSHRRIRTTKFSAIRSRSTYAAATRRNIRRLVAACIIVLAHRLPGSSCRKRCGRCPRLIPDLNFPMVQARDSHPSYFRRCHRCVSYRLALSPETVSISPQRYPCMSDRDYRLLLVNSPTVLAYETAPSNDR